jgi:hypothetical protein
MAEEAAGALFWFILMAPGNRSRPDARPGPGAGLAPRRIGANRDVLQLVWIPNPQQLYCKDLWRNTLLSASYPAAGLRGLLCFEVSPVCNGEHQKCSLRLAQLSGGQFCLGTLWQSFAARQRSPTAAMPATRDGSPTVHT